MCVKLKGKPVIPYDHQYYLASYIYRTVERSDPSYSLDLHKIDVPKPFTFSYLMAEKRKNLKNGIRILSDSVYFYISSPAERFIKGVIDGMLSYPDIKIGNLKGIISEVRILQRPKFSKNMTFQTTAPIVVRKPVKKNGRLSGIELYPTDKEFYTLIEKNLNKKYELFHKQRINGVVKLNFIHFKPKRHRILNTHYRCSLGIFQITGNQRLIELGYDVGFGEKNSMGFGMVKVV
ncbi:MAG: CRISPR-associated endoribonuclease Cas6 [Candidatus Aenigmatarchaeota archaeon]|nr:MAG: CRISPR-associated endoribonuclease Cas6 [Candidatus Aenigmarchaeota archaeon]